MFLCNAGLPIEGSRVSVYWPGEDDWFDGTVKAVDKRGRSFVSYDDGQIEILHFALERFKLLDNTPASGGSSLAAYITCTTHKTLSASYELLNRSTISSLC